MELVFLLDVNEFEIDRIELLCNMNVSQGGLIDLLMNYQKEVMILGVQIHL